MPEYPWYPRCRWCNGVIHWSWNGGWVHVAEYGSAVIKPCGDGKHEAEPESAATMSDVKLPELQGPTESIMQALQRNHSELLAALRESAADKQRIAELERGPCCREPWCVTNV